MISAMATRRPWWLKAGIQGTLSLLPQPQRWNRLLQRYVTRNIHLRDRTFQRKWDQVRWHYKHWSARRDNPIGVALELGTGWHPIVPIGLALLGVPRVITIDITDMVSQRTLAEVLNAYVALLDGEIGDVAVSQERASIIRELAAAPQRQVNRALDRLGITTAVADARATGFDAGSVDLFVSNNTLEHLPKSTIADVFAEYRRLSTRSGVMSHYIDMTDHYASFDRAITVYNFLRFSDRTWRVFNNDLQYQNRLRVSDFRHLHADATWAIVEERNETDASAFERVPLAPRFSCYSREDCMVYATWQVSQLASP